MHRLIASLLLLSTVLFGAYDIKIGVYKNEKNLRANIAKIKDAKYRKSIIVEKKRNLYYVHAVIDSNKEAKNALRVYKRIFKDAFIAKKQVSSRTQIKKARATKETKQESPAKKVVKEASVKAIAKSVALTSVVKETVQNQTVEPAKPQVLKPVERLNAKELLADKTMYMCYEEGPAHLEGRVVEMVFQKDGIVYNPLKKMTKPVTMPYSFKENNLTLELSGMKITHGLYKKGAKCLYAQSIVDGSAVNKLRYYFKKESAEAFVAGR